MGTGASTKKAAKTTLPGSVTLQTARQTAGLSLNVSRQPSGQTYLISAASSENLGDVMRRHNFLNDDQVKIYFAGQEMQVDQNKTLAEFGIVDGSTIILVVVVCNGSSCAY